jgi:hypothetical protein
MPLELKFNARELEAGLHQIGDRAMKGMTAHMRKTVIRISDLARDFAPVRTGLLENSIKWAAMPVGVNRRHVYVVYVDVEAVRREGNGTLGDYAWIMEEHLHPYGRGTYKGRHFGLGPGSQAKASSGKKVGGKFLQRAMKLGIKSLSQMEQDAGLAVRRATGGSLVRGTRVERDEGED